jgi:hypothetical protein
MLHDADIRQQDSFGTETRDLRSFWQNLVLYDRKLRPPLVRAGYQRLCRRQFCESPFPGQEEIHELPTDNL